MASHTRHGRLLELPEKSITGVRSNRVGLYSTSPHKISMTLQVISFCMKTDISNENCFGKCDNCKSFGGFVFTKSVNLDLAFKVQESKKIVAFGVMNNVWSLDKCRRCSAKKPTPEWQAEMRNRGVC